MSDDNGFLKTILVGVVLLVLVLFGLFSLIHSEARYRQAKLEHVFELAKEFRVTLRQTNAQFSDRWNEYENDAVDPNGGNIGEQAYADLVNRFLAMDANRDNFVALEGFYDSVGQCVQVGLCDFWFARETFGNDIVAFYHNMYPVIEAQNHEGRGGAGILDFVDRMARADRGELRRDWRDNAIAWANY